MTSPKSSRRVHQDSVINIKKKIAEEENGPLAMDGEPWTNEQKNTALLCYICDVAYISSGIDMRKLLGRSWKAIERMVWGIAVKYCNPKSHSPRPPIYRSDLRLYRKGQPFNKQELLIMRKCLKARNKYGTFKVSYLAELLGREEAEVQQEIEKRAVRMAPQKATNLVGWNVPNKDLTQEEKLDYAYQSLLKVK